MYNRGILKLRRISTVYIFLLLAISMFLISLSSAQLTFSKTQVIDIKLPCIYNGTYCLSAACNLTVKYPNGSLLSHGAMSDNGYNFNRTILTDRNNPLGNYEGTMVCCTAGGCGSEDFEFEVTPNGEEATVPKAILYISLFVILVIFLILSLYFFFETDQLLTKVASLGMAYLFLTIITFIGWNMAADFLASSPIIASMMRTIFWVLISGAFPLLLGMFAWYFLMLWRVKEIQRMLDKGIPYDEAKRRAKVK